MIARVDQIVNSILKQQTISIKGNQLKKFSKSNMNNKSAPYCLGIGTMIEEIELSSVMSRNMRQCKNSLGIRSGSAIVLKIDLLAWLLFDSKTENPKIQSKRELEMIPAVCTFHFFNERMKQDELK
jgi:hypothetical protein